jgi:hypothetical protein
VVPMLISLISLVLVLVGCLLVHRCGTLLALRALQIGLVVSYYDIWVKLGQGGVSVVPRDSSITVNPAWSFFICLFPRSVA